MLNWRKWFGKKQCDQDCVIDGILARAKGVDTVKDEIDEMKRQHREVSEIIRGLKIKLAVLQANINRREESLEIAITEFNKIRINNDVDKWRRADDDSLAYKEAELESLKRMKSELLFAMTSLVYKNNQEFNKRLDVLNERIKQLEEDIENGE